VVFLQSWFVQESCIMKTKADNARELEIEVFMMKIIKVLVS